MGRGVFCGATSGMGFRYGSGATSVVGLISVLTSGATSGIGRISGATSGIGLISGAISGMGRISGATSGIGRTSGLGRCCGFRGVLMHDSPKDNEAQDRLKLF